MIINFGSHLTNLSYRFQLLVSVLDFTPPPRTPKLLSTATLPVSAEARP